MHAFTSQYQQTTHLHSKKIGNFFSTHTNKTNIHNPFKMYRDFVDKVLEKVMENVNEIEDGRNESDVDRVRDAVIVRFFIIIC